MRRDLSHSRNERCHTRKTSQAIFARQQEKMKSKVPKHKRMNPDEYRADPTAAELRFQIALMGEGCSVPYCARTPVIFHHEKQDHPMPRRDHKFGCALCDYHHQQVHHKFSWDLDRIFVAYGIQLTEISTFNRNRFDELSKRK